MRQVAMVGIWVGIMGVFLIAILWLAPGGATGVAWKVAQMDYVWSFPQDHWARSGYKTEWWYFTGHLQTATGRRFGYQFTFFRVGVLPAEPELNSDWRTTHLIMGHAALSDLSQKKHRFSEVLYRAIPLLGGFGRYPDTVIAWSRGPAGTNANWHLEWNGTAFDLSMSDVALGFGFALSTQPRKGLIFQGANGFSRKGEGTAAASQYYSFTRLKTVGSITLDGNSYQVTGQSWMDKEFGSNGLAENQVGWDWFSLQLDDRREIMLYILRDQKGDVDFAHGTVVDADGQVRYLNRDEFSIEVHKRWKSPKTSDIYPAHWNLVIPGTCLEIEVVPDMADQENRSRLVPEMHYWEGSVSVLQSREPIGKGYVELTGYGRSSRPAI